MKSLVKLGLFPHSGRKCLCSSLSQHVALTRMQQTTADTLMHQPMVLGLVCLQNQNQSDMTLDTASPETRIEMKEK